MRQGVIDRIRREVTNHKQGKPSGITWKLNSLVDPIIIDELYAASQAGVPIKLIVRGICCLRPGVKKVSETISVTSIVGRFIEHSLIYWFENGGKPDVLIGSADMMRRNLDRRVEVLAPVESKALQSHIRTNILEVCLKDTVRAWQLTSEGTYIKAKSKSNGGFDSQEWFMQNPSTRRQFKT